MGGEEPKLSCSAPRCYLHASREFLRACKMHLSVIVLLSLNNVFLSTYFAPVQAGVYYRQRMHSRGQHTLSGKSQDFASGPKSLTIQMFGFLLYFFLLCVCVCLLCVAFIKIQRLNYSNKPSRPTPKRPIRFKPAHTM